MTLDNDDYERLQKAREKRMKAVLERGEAFHAYMAFGPGWDSLVLKLDETLSKIDPGYNLNQMKEKFGGLRYYCSNSEGITEQNFERFNNAIRAAEDESYKTCELCGIKDNTVSLKSKNYWYRTRCKKCEDL